MTYMETVNKIKKIARNVNLDAVKLTAWVDGWYWDRYRGRYFYHNKHKKVFSQEGRLRDLAHWAKDFDQNAKNLDLVRWKLVSAAEPYIAAEIVQFNNITANPN